MHVTKRFAGATASSVKAAMAQKCKDKTEMLIRKEKKLQKTFELLSFFLIINYFVW
jgi:predicted nucleic acid-binding Zn ribbon protein